MRGREATRETVHALAEQAEAIGLDALFCTDHLVSPPIKTSRALHAASGDIPPAWKERYLEPFAVLGYLAGVTRRITLGTSVCILPMRNPIEVAKQVTVLDELSAGRMVFGVGVGWYREEIEALGHAFTDRGARTDEGLEIIKALWTQERPSFAGQRFNFEQVYFGPKPRQQPHPPIWVGGASAGALRRMARFGDVWHPFVPTWETLERGRETLARLFAEQGRKDALRIAPKLPLVFQDEATRPGQYPTEGRPEDILAALRRFRDLGAEFFLFDFKPETLDNALRTLDRFAAEIRPKL